MYLIIIRNSILLVLTALVLASCADLTSTGDGVGRPAARALAYEDSPLETIDSDAVRKVIENAVEQTRLTPNYTQEYFVIDYPNGDVPIDTGACTDVVIRAFRAAGIDLQKEVHEDMKANFSRYPQKWGLARTDTNIDHRRVPNLHTYFTRKGKALPVSSAPENYKPGDVVAWDLNGKGMTHIGLVSNFRDRGSGRYKIIHNIGAGTKIEDRLFEWKITGHFRYFD